MLEAVVAQTSWLQEVSDGDVASTPVTVLPQHLGGHGSVTELGKQLVST